MNHNTAVETRIDALKWSDNKHLCCTCKNADSPYFDNIFDTTTLSPNDCAYFEESPDEEIKVEDNGGGYWVIKCPFYEASNTFYHKYMKSDIWKKKRAEIIKRDGYKCTNPKCGSAINLVVHHTTYEHLGYEDDTELITLCKKCHEKLHESDLKNGGGN